MNTSPELTCFDCPVICEIGAQLLRSNDVRAQTMAQSIRVMSECSQIEDTGVECTDLKARWQNTSDKIISLLDSAERKLISSRIGLIETCDVQYPVLVDAQANTNNLECSSVLARQVMRAISVKNE